MECQRKLDITVRKCLKCGRDFLSKGIGNRLCEICGRENGKQYKANSVKMSNGRCIKKEIGAR